MNSEREDIPENGFCYCCFMPGSDYDKCQFDTDLFRLVSVDSFVFNNPTLIKTIPSMHQIWQDTCTLVKI